MQRLQQERDHIADLARRTNLPYSERIIALMDAVMQNAARSLDLFHQAELTEEAIGSVGREVGHLQELADWIPRLARRLEVGAMQMSMHELNEAYFDDDWIRAWGVEERRLLAKKALLEDEKEELAEEIERMQEETMSMREEMAGLLGMAVIQ